MKLLKVCKSIDYRLIFDEIPEMTYEKYGMDYIGSVTDDNGNVIFSDYLKYGGKSWGGAFGGREINLKMKDGSIETIKDYWWDSGYCKNHGEFIECGTGTLKDLQRCFVFCSNYINKNAFKIMMDEYLSRDKIYEYRELEEWTKLQYKWYPVIIDGKETNLMVNYVGDFVERESKKRVYVRTNTCYMRYYDKIGRTIHECYFKYKYKDKENNLIKIERNMLRVLQDSLPNYSKEEIIKNCELYI